MPSYNLLLLPGDGIGPEVMGEVKKLIAWMNAHGMGTFNTEEGLCGGCAYDAHGVAVDPDTQSRVVSEESARKMREYVAKRFPGLRDCARQLPLVGGARPG